MMRSAAHETNAVFPPVQSGIDGYEKVQAIIHSLRADRVHLIEALFRIQEIFGYIPDPVVGMLAQGFLIPRSEILAIATSVPALFLKPRGRFVIRVCGGMTCAICGSAGFLESLRRLLKVKDHEVTKDGKFSICPVMCLGACDKGPAVMINHRLFGHLDEKRLVQLIQKISREGLEDSE